MENTPSTQEQQPFASTESAIAPEPGRNTRHGLSLSSMMFLQYAIWGIWLPYLANYLQAPVDKGGLGFTGGQIGWILGLAGSIGAVAAPFLAGQVADRFISAEKYLGLLLIGGGVVKFITASAHDYHLFMFLSILYSLMYMPTLALTNSIAFAHLDRPEQQFPAVRVWGTVGWIVASNAFPLMWLQNNVHLTWLPPFLEGVEKSNATALMADCLRVAGVLSVGYGLWAMLFLPRTPPTHNVENPLAFARAFGLLKQRGFLVVTLAALPIAMIHQAYFIRSGPYLESLGFGEAYIGPILSLGQVSEIVFMALLGLIIARLGYRWTLAVGCIAYAARFAVFAAATPATRHLAVVAVPLHGLSYACFFAGAFIFVERVATADIRHSAQTVFGIIILGVGPVLAGLYNQYFDRFKVEGVVDGVATAVQSYSQFWWAQAAVAVVCAAGLAAAFPPGKLGVGSWES